MKLRVDWSDRGGLKQVGMRMSCYVVFGEMRTAFHAGELSLYLFSSEQQERVNRSTAVP